MDRPGFRCAQARLRTRNGSPGGYGGAVAPRNAITLLPRCAHTRAGSATPAPGLSLPARVRYTGDKLGSSETGANVEKFARRIADRYPAGSAIEIHYNPANPAEAIVKPGGRALLLLWLLPLGMLILAYIAAQ